MPASAGVCCWRWPPSCPSHFFFFLCELHSYSTKCPLHIACCTNIYMWYDNTIEPFLMMLYCKYYKYKYHDNISLSRQGCLIHSGDHSLWWGLQTVSPRKQLTIWLMSGQCCWSSRRTAKCWQHSLVWSPPGCVFKVYISVISKLTDISVLMSDIILLFYVTQC